MKYRVFIVRNDTGEGRWVDDEYGDSADGFYIWEDGNYACDCNRHLFWVRAGGGDEEDRECGDTAYSIPYAELEDGTRVMIDQLCIWPRESNTPRA